MAGDVKQTRDGSSLIQTHEELRRMLLRGEIPPGTSISQVALANRLGVGRTPVREALRLLESEGLLVAEPNRSVRIAGLSPDDVEDLYCLRIATECAAVLITVPQLKSEDFAELEGFLAQMDHFAHEGDPSAWEVPHRAFHMRLVSGAGQRMRQSIELLWDHAERYRHWYAHEARWLKRADEHRHLADAAKQRDSDATAALLADHYARTVAETAEAIGATTPFTKVGRIQRQFSER